jgi:hypothetical protein
MERLVAAGKIARWGVGNLDIEDMTELMAGGGEGCATDQILYNMTRRAPSLICSRGWRAAASPSWPTVASNRAGCWATPPCARSLATEARRRRKSPCLAAASTGRAAHPQRPAWSHMCATIARRRISSSTTASDLRTFCLGAGFVESGEVSIEGANGPSPVGKADPRRRRASAGSGRSAPRSRAQGLDRPPPSPARNCAREAPETLGRLGSD